jgi:glutathione synthase/RimK-type ligase-like ATP-grasp enzyme
MQKGLLLFSKIGERSEKISNFMHTQLHDRYEVDTVYGYSKIQMYQHNNELTFLINGEPLNTYSFVYLYTTPPSRSSRSDIVGLIGQYCLHKNIHVINTRDVLRYNGGKIMQKLLLSLGNIPIPDFAFYSELVEQSYDDIVKIIGEPFVLKQSKAALGREVYLIQSRDEFISKIQDLEIKDHTTGLWYCEKYIPHTNTIRGFVTGDECKIAIHVSAEEGSFKTNRGTAVFENNTDENFTQLVVTAARLVKLEIAGVDTIRDSIDNVVKVLEVNKSPGITFQDETSKELEVVSDFLKKLS